MVVEEKKRRWERGKEKQQQKIASLPARARFIHFGRAPPNKKRVVGRGEGGKALPLFPAAKQARARKHTLGGGYASEPEASFSALGGDRELLPPPTPNPRQTPRKKRALEIMFFFSHPRSLSLSLSLPLSLFLSLPPSLRPNSR